MRIFNFEDGAISGPENADDKEHYGFGPENFQKALIRAEELGLEVVMGQPNTLLLDLDSDKGCVLNVKVLETILDHLGMPITTEEWTSKSGKNRHVVLTFPKSEKFEPLEAIIMEVALGSDPWRGFLSMMDMRHGVENPRTLFRPKQ